MPPGLEDVCIRLSFFGLVEEIAFRDDADKLAGAIDDRQTAHPVTFEKPDRVLESRLWRCCDDTPRHHVLDGDHASMLPGAPPAGMGPCAPEGWAHRP